MKSNRTPATWEVLGAACKGVSTAVDEGIHAHLERDITRLEAMYEERDMRGLYKHLKNSVGFGGRPSGGQQYVKNDDGVLLNDKGEILQRRGEVLQHSFQHEIPHAEPSHHREGAAKASSTNHRRFGTAWIGSNAGGDKTNSPGDAQLEGAWP